MHHRPSTLSWLASIALLAASLATAAPKVPDPATMAEIKAYCLDFNWQGSGRRMKIADPDFMHRADPQAVVAWHQALGSNVIQTFCISHNGYAWYRNDITPQVPGLQHDFLREVVKLGHAQGMVVMGYFSIAANLRWAEQNPTLSYGGGGYHLPYTDQYLAYLSSAIGDAVRTTGIDGFMVDWIWQPTRKATDGKWIEAEKNLYQQLMGEPFPGEEKLTPAQDLAYSRKALDRCWKTIRKAAKDANPKCIVWLTCNEIHHPHIKDSDMFREVDWLMAETGDNKHLEDIRNSLGKHTRLLTCLAAWNNADPFVVIPDAQAKKIGLYGFCKPSAPDGTIPLEPIFKQQLTMLTGDARNIAALARAYHGKSLDSVWNGSTFSDPENPLSFRLRFPGRGRGQPDTGRITVTADTTLATIRTPYHAGQVTLVRTLPAWPTTRIRLENRENQTAQSTSIRISNGILACEFPLQENAPVTWGTPDGIKTGKQWKLTANQATGSQSSMQASVKKTSEFIEITIPSAILKSNPDLIVCEWLK